MLLKTPTATTRPQRPAVAAKNAKVTALEGRAAQLRRDAALLGHSNPADERRLLAEAAQVDEQIAALQAPPAPPTDADRIIAERIDRALRAGER
jgi:hypothetical protein